MSRLRMEQDHHIPPHVCLEIPRFGAVRQLRFISWRALVLVMPKHKNLRAELQLWKLSHGLENCHIHTIRKVDGVKDTEHQLLEMAELGGSRFSSCHTVILAQSQ